MIKLCETRPYQYKAPVVAHRKVGQTLLSDNIKVTDKNVKVDACVDATFIKGEILRWAQNDNVDACIDATVTG